MMYAERLMACSQMFVFFMIIVVYSLPICYNSLLKKNWPEVWEGIKNRTLKSTRSCVIFNLFQ